MNLEINNKESVIMQYKNADNLNVRISIHDKYSVNKQGFGNWIISNYGISEGMRVLELGCGTGSMWRNHADIIEKCSELWLTDLSEGMLQEAHVNIGDFPNARYQVVDIQEIPFEAKSFDIVIANMMLYHVPDLKKGLSEVARVLKDDGRFYCATGGERNIMQFVANLLKPYGVDYKANNNFTLQNGKAKLVEYFSEVEILDYVDSLEITNIDDLIDYIYSGITFSKICTLDRQTVKKILSANMKNGVLKVPKECGMFVCRH